MIKQTIKRETYLYGTTLIGEEYSADCFSDLYHERWSIEELYKISKNIIDIEDFHSKIERGVKQEIYAHLLLINLSRFFEFDAQDSLPPMNQEDKEKCDKAEFYKYAEIKNWTAKIISMILNVRQKVRPGRSFPRRSYKPEKKWGKKGQKIGAMY